jgi:ABC-type multidrug transport system ATPase subunit
VKEYCNRALLLENGHVVVEGSPDEVVAVHRQHTEEANQRKAAEARAAGLAPEIAAKGR